MRRRDLLALVVGVGTAIASDRSARAQRRSLPLVAFINPQIAEINVGAFRRGLRELGYVEGRNIMLETRSADSDNRRLPTLAAELAKLNPDVIVTSGEPARRRRARSRS
jgi:putative tryptophan/tyrosine transport system substrate-binding protein